MNTATLLTVPVLVEATRYEISFGNMQRSRTMYVESHKLHLQMTLWCDCERCHRRESYILGTLERQHIPYTVENFAGQNEHERFVCIERNGQDPVEQIKSQTGLEVWHSRQYQSIHAEQKAKTRYKVMAGTLIAMGAVLTIWLAVLLYRFLNPRPDILVGMGVYVGISGILLLLRITFSERKLQRLLLWLGSLGSTLAVMTAMALADKLQKPYDVFVHGLSPAWSQVVGIVAGLAGICGIVLLMATMLCIVMCTMLWLFCSDAEVGL